MKPSFQDFIDCAPPGLAVPVWEDENGEDFARFCAPITDFKDPSDSRQKVASVLFFQSQVETATQAFLDWCRDNGAQCAFARHPPEPPKGVHVHAVARFKAPKRYDSIFAKLRELDSHFYLDKGTNFRKCVRYCVHLDNPEKAPIPRDQLQTFGDWQEGELENILAEHLDYSLLFKTLKAAQEQGQSPEETCCFIVRMGYTMSQISQCVRAAKDVREYWGMPALSSPSHEAPF